MTLADALAKQLTRDEGKFRKMYSDSKGIPTIGIGHNLRDKPISERAVQLIFEDDVADAVTDLSNHFPWASGLDEARLGVLINMAFNMGISRLLEFRKFLAALQSDNYVEAAKEMLDSKWEHDVGPRAHRLAKQMETGVWQ